MQRWFYFANSNRYFNLPMCVSPSHVRETMRREANGAKICRRRYVYAQQSQYKVYTFKPTLSAAAYQKEFFLVRR